MYDGIYAVGVEKQAIIKNVTECIARKLGKVCGPLPKTLNLILTKTGDTLPYLWPDRKYDTLFMTIAADTVSLKTI